MLRVFALLAALAGAAAWAAPPISPDSMAARTQACTLCHGPQGRAGPDGYYPRIAGKPAGYLYNQLLHFREGRRHYGLMAGLLDPLSDAYLADIARHFAAQEAPYPPPQPATAPAATLERGRQLTVNGDPAKRLPACASCHGAALTGVEPLVPGLLGLPRDYLNAQLGAWRNGQRQSHAPDCMADIARALSAEDLSAVTAYLAAQPVPANAKAVAERAQGTRSVPRCGSAVMPAGEARP
ncbi:cytochrome c [Ramlibacter sp.]|uniref:c-type cytochrome n=1 Tax=Ramlibacter sp. TaxID=1917967 RepID=UPI0035B40A58